MLPRLITVGEPAGIGPDCIIRGWQQATTLFEQTVVVAPAAWLVERAAAIGISVPLFEYPTLAAAVAAKHPAAAGLVCWNPHPATAQVTPGKPDCATAAQVVGCIEAAALACLHRQAAAMITAPIEKAVLRRAGFNFPGHTEFLAHLAATHTEGSQSDDFVMMLASDQLRVALLTTHMALRDVADQITIEESLRCIAIIDHDLRSRFRIAAPKLALCGLNPHAGEQGHFGREEIELLAPAAAAARQQGIDITDPMPADTLFSAPVRCHYDAMICCYHDQALIPLKTLSFGDAVNITLGLPFVRTSVDHGTALDKVGSSAVSCSSLLAAIRMAIRMSDVPQ